MKSGINFSHFAQEWAKWSWKAFCATKCPIFSINYINYLFWAKVSRHFGRIRQYSTESSDRLQSCTVSYSFWQNAEQEWAKWRWEAFCAIKCPIFSINYINHLFWAKVSRHFGRIRHYSTESSDRLQSCTVSHSFLQNTIVINDSKQIISSNLT